MDQKQIDEIINQAIEKAAESYRKGEVQNAEALYRQILCVNPNHIVALQMLGLLESKNKEKQDDALKHLMHALELEPDNHDIHNNLGLFFSWSSTRNDEKADYHYRKSIALNPKSIIARSNLGIHLKSLNKSDESEAVFKEALELEPDNSALHFNYGTLLGELHRWEEAKRQYLMVLDKDPENPPAHYNLSNIYFFQNNWEEGWKHYEYRWQTYPMFKKISARFTDGENPIPIWKGEDLNGKRILLYTEQGMGDSLQFLRFCTALQSMGAYVIVEEHSDLIDLIEQTPGIDQIVRLGKDELPAFDYHQSVVSLPYYLKVFDIDNDKRLWDKPYVKTNYKKLPELSILEAKNWSTYGDNFRIGIVWAGNPVHRNDHIRSTYLKYFRELLLPNVKLFSLQKDIRPRVWPGLGEHDLAENSEGMGVVDLKDFMIDFNCSAALIDQMDLIITVDTATAHLAGAMGKPVWMLVAWHNDWRWMSDRSDTPWYPSMKIFRQPKPYDWASVFTEVRKDLEKLLQPL